MKKTRRADRRRNRGFSRRFMALVIGIGLCPVSAWPQEIIGACGTPLGELEPWGQGPAGPVADAGMARRIEEIVRPFVARLDAAERELAALRPQKAEALLDALTAAQPSICESVLALTGLLKRHENEVGAWNLGGQRRAVGASGPGFGMDLLERALAQELDAGQPSAPQAMRWSECAAAWISFQCCIRLGADQERLLAELGLGVHGHADRPEWAWSTLALFLRQYAAGAGGVIYPGTALRDLCERLVPSLVVAHRLGEAASPDEIHARAEELCGRGGVAGLFRPEGLVAHDREGGEYLFQALPPAAQEKVQSTLARFPLTLALRAGCATRRLKADALARAYTYRLAQYRFLVADCARRVEEGVPATDTQRMYSPFLLLLTLFPPCLTPYHPEVVNDNWVRWVDDAPVPPGESAAAGRGPPAVDGRLCLLQADGWREPGGEWNWTPRAAGSRRYVELYLARRSTVARAGGRP